MTLVDSSAWIEFLRGSGSPTNERLRTVLKEGAELACTDTVLMEVLAGARNDAHRDELRRLLYSVEFLATDGPADYESAAELYRLCRSKGETPRNLSDCLIAVVAMRNEADVLCADADFRAIARRASLRLASGSA
jgi:predicted nucleic acid-binding protein